MAYLSENHDANLPAAGLSFQAHPYELDYFFQLAAWLAQIPSPWGRLG